ncbi:hypothetical protein [Thermococcus thermotolerans]|uniref:hypothetical protein n=1 Tax=Thermococcus thermotolerans TaxID=2969672 RepID=UPI002157776D|nr:hypothetical protein [Thermococcus thermotolerans]
MKPTRTQILEELTYTAKHIGINLLLIPFMTAVLYWMASLNPIPSDKVIGSLSISLSIIVSLFFSGTVSREKLLGIHEILLSLPLDPVQLVFIRALGGFIIGITGIALGSIVGWVLTEYLGNPLSLTKIFSGVLISAPPLFSFIFLVILITFLFHSTRLDVAKGIIAFVAFFAPLYISKYLGTGLSIPMAFGISLLLSTGAIALSFSMIKSLGTRLGEKMVLI